MSAHFESNEVVAELNGNWVLEIQDFGGPVLYPAGLGKE